MVDSSRRHRNRKLLKQITRGVGGPHGFGDHAAHGAESSARFDLNVVAPVICRPARRWRPARALHRRQAGSSEECRLTQPCRALASSRSLSSAPYATTAQHRAPARWSSATNSLSLLGRSGRSNRDVSGRGPAGRPVTVRVWRRPPRRRAGQHRHHIVARRFDELQAARRCGSGVPAKRRVASDAR